MFLELIQQSRWLQASISVTTHVKTFYFPPPILMHLPTAPRKLLPRIIALFLPHYPLLALLPQVLTPLLPRFLFRSQILRQLDILMKTFKKLPTLPWSHSYKVKNTLKVKLKQLKTITPNSSPLKLDSLCITLIIHIWNLICFAKSVRTTLTQLELQSQTKSLL